MRIGVVSDTHNHLANVSRIVELLNEARVDCVVHTGDITRATTLEVLSHLQAPLRVVFGNNDYGERQALENAARGHDITLGEPPLELHLAGRRIVVVHDPRDLGDSFHSEHHVALHGHTHRRTIERSGGRLIFNPGECAGHVPGLNAIGVVNLETLEAEILHF